MTLHTPDPEMPKNGDRPTPTKAITVHIGREPPVETQADRIERQVLECYEMIGHVAREVSLVKADGEAIRVETRRIADTVALLSGARTSDVPGDPTNRPPPMRDRLPSSLDLKQVEILEPAPDGQPRYVTTSQQFRQVIATEIAKDRQQQQLIEAAAPTLWVKKNATMGATAALMAACTAAGASLFLLLKQIFGWK